MTEPFFNEPPTPELLQWLTKGSLKQNFRRSVRLWVWLQCLYGEERIALNERFTYAQWRDSFFSPSHPKGEEIPTFNDSQCFCQKTVADWLFSSSSSSGQTQWCEMIAPQIAPMRLDDILQQRLFGVTRRTLQGDLYCLAELGWLIRDRSNQYFQKVSQFPLYPQSKHFADHHESLPLVNLDLELSVRNFSQLIGGHQRFFLDVDYIISNKYIDQVEDWQALLKSLWQQTPTPPILLTYCSVKYKTVVDCIVYPVCLYYMRRAIYLCAMGQTPAPQIQWYNFRLNKIEKISPLNWQYSQIPRFLSKVYPDHLPTPEYIQNELEQAWGFDFYLPSQLLLLRFKKSFHDNYIQDTYRHNTFKKITYQKVGKLLESHSPKSELREHLKVLNQRSSDDAYYQVYYRDGDINVLHRLFSWRPYVEVLFPSHLRQAIAQVIQEELVLYC